MPAPIIQTSVKFRDFEDLYLRQFSTNHFQNLAMLLILRRSFQWCQLPIYFS